LGDLRRRNWAKVARIAIGQEPTSPPGKAAGAASYPGKVYASVFAEDVDTVLSAL
jgi:hypothetical protein